VARTFISSLLVWRTPRRAASYEPVRRTHLPPALDSGLVALNRSLGASFLFAGDVTDARQIEHWIGQILADKLQPTGKMFGQANYNKY
jgi:hypothetical protein